MTRSLFQFMKYGAGNTAGNTAGSFLCQSTTIYLQANVRLDHKP